MLIIDMEMPRTCALMFDIHISGEDCPYECERWERYKIERKDDEQIH